MQVTRADKLPIRSAADIVSVRQAVRAWVTELSFSIVDQTKMVTAASELARNTLDYGLGGDMHMEALLNNGRVGIRLTFEDQGPGIPDIQQALKDGFTSGGGLGLGLGGARRLCNEFEIESTLGKGTRIAITRWK